jgi:transposase-like protein
MPTCKQCGQETNIKSGFVGGRQRYRCKPCNYYFRLGDNRTSDKTDAVKVMSVLLYALTKYNFRDIARLLRCEHSLVYMFVRRFGEKLPVKKRPMELKHVELKALTPHFFLNKDSAKLLQNMIQTHTAVFPDETTKEILEFLNK